uniref:Tripartite motif-containing protein 2 n=1 Tax=Magallana gigas TaxID=29159 RepID=K1PN90_MAGGI
MLSSISPIYSQKKDEVTARGEEWHKEIEKIVKKLHQELDDMQNEHEALLKKKETEYEELIKNLDQLNTKATSLQKSHDVKEMLTFIQMIEKQEVLTELTQVSFPKFCVCKSEENILQTRFGYVEKLSEIKINFLEKKFRKNQLFQKRFLEIPLVTSVIDTGFPADEKYASRLYDMAITDDNKVWVGGNGDKLKLFDFQGNLHQIVNTNWNGYHLCMYNNKVVYSGYRAMEMISKNNSVLKMFSTGDWNPRGVTSTASGDLLVCFIKDDDQSKVVRYSNNYTVLQEIQYDSHCQPLYRNAYYITENVNRDIIVSDMKKSAVIAVNRLGIFRYSYSGNNQRFMTNSVASDNFGHVIISDFMETTIHMLDKDGKFMRYIIPEGGIKCPRVVCIIGHGEMIIGECKTGLAKIIKYLEE